MNKIISKLKEAKKRKQRQTVELDRINKALKNHKLNLAMQKLENGTILESPGFKVGDPIFIVGGSDPKGKERIPLPPGSYKMADGKTLVVRIEGVIFSYLKTKKK